MGKFDKYLQRENESIPEEHMSIIKNRERINSSGALSRNNINALFSKGYLDAEDGFCRLDNGSMYTSVLTKMPNVTLDMINWWFWWHAAEGVRYQIWYPDMHFDIDSDFGGHYDDESKSYIERLHLSSHLVTEDIGMGKEEILINFKSPIEFGFDGNKLDSKKNTIICANVGSPGKGLWFVDMCHFVRVTSDGVEMRSRFWMGHHIQKMKGNGKSFLTSILNKPFVKRNLIPNKAGWNMFHHCSQEYHNLAAILPELYAEEYKE